MTTVEPVTSMLPDPPEEGGWSIVTLAAHLCLPAHVVFAHLDLDADLRGDRLGHSFDDADNWPQGDCYLWPVAAARVAALHPAATIARAIVADPDLLAQVQRISGPALLHLARHIVDHSGDQG